MKIVKLSLMFAVFTFGVLHNDIEAKSVSSKKIFLDKVKETLCLKAKLGKTKKNKNKYNDSDRENARKALEEEIKNLNTVDFSNKDLACEKLDTIVANAYVTTLDNQSLNLLMTMLDKYYTNHKECFVLQIKLEQKFYEILQTNPHNSRKTKLNIWVEKAEIGLIKSEIFSILIRRVNGEFEAIEPGNEIRMLNMNQITDTLKNIIDVISNERVQHIFERYDIFFQRLWNLYNENSFNTFPPLTPYVELRFYEVINKVDSAKVQKNRGMFIIIMCFGTSLVSIPSGQEILVFRLNNFLFTLKNILWVLTDERLLVAIANLERLVQWMKIYAEKFKEYLPMTQAQQNLILSKVQSVKRTPKVDNLALVMQGEITKLLSVERHLDQIVEE